jgi:hypothetical protein
MQIATAIVLLTYRSWVISLVSSMRSSHLTFTEIKWLITSSSKKHSPLVEQTTSKMIYRDKNYCMEEKEGF